MAASLAMLAGVLSPAHADPGSATSACREAGVQVERTSDLPPGILGAIGIVESGRPDPETGRFGAWPWTINAEGAGQVFATRLEAVAATRALQERGVASIDVGCFQVNLFYHPSAFASLEEAFDPQANAVYAARFLSSLRRATGSWQNAVAAYHSADPERGGVYRERIWAIFGRTDSDGVAGAQRIDRVMVWPGVQVTTRIQIWTPRGLGLAPSVIAMPLSTDEPRNKLPTVTRGVFSRSALR